MERELFRPFNDPEALRDPQWSRAGRVHDWRNHVGEHTRAIWDTFTDDQRLALAADADYRAGGEHWD